MPETTTFVVAALGLTAASSARDRVQPRDLRLDHGILDLGKQDLALPKRRPGARLQSRDFVPAHVALASRSADHGPELLGREGENRPTSSGPCSALWAATATCMAQS